jgi:hypothetical protein
MCAAAIGELVKSTLRVIPEIASVGRRSGKQVCGVVCDSEDPGRFQSWWRFCNAVAGKRGDY